MIRSMTSIVSALSGIVANGHQTLHFVSSAPSKIPYGGFSPVRLQTRFTPRPPSAAGTHHLIGRHGSYLRPQLRLRHGTCVQSVPGASDQNHESSGPWLPDRFFCPASSSLTMATSEALGFSGPLICFVRPALPRTLVRENPEIPQFILSVFPRVPSSVPRWVRPLRVTVSSGSMLPFASFQQARDPQLPARRFSQGHVTRLQSSLYGTARSVACPSPTRAFTTKLAPLRVTSARCWLSLHRQQSIPVTGLSPARPNSFMGCG